MENQNRINNLNNTIIENQRSINSISSEMQEQVNENNENI